MPESDPLIGRMIAHYRVVASGPLLPRGYHFFAAATETLVDEPALATFFSA